MFAFALRCAIFLLLLFLASISNIWSTLEECNSGIELVRDMEESLFEEGFMSDTTASIVKLEQSLLDIGASSSVTQGLFYMFPILSGGNIFLRFAHKQH